MIQVGCVWGVTRGWTVRKKGSSGSGLVGGKGCGRGVDAYKVSSPIMGVSDLERGRCGSRERIDAIVCDSGLWPACHLGQCVDFIL